MPINLDALDAEYAMAADRAGLPVTSVDRAYMARLQRSQSAAVDRMTRPGGPAAAPLFVTTRPRADRLVYVLLGQLADLDTDAAADARAWYERNRETLTVAQGSDWINRLRAKIAACPATPVATDTPETVDQQVWDEWHRMAGELAALGGRYGARFAVDTEPNAVNRLAFWWISPTKTPGRFFLRQIIGGQGPVRVRMTPQAMIAIAHKINAAGPESALARYGQELGECGHCGRELTNDESRRLGIGPWCRKNN